MDLSQQKLLNRIGKTLAIPLSNLMRISAIERIARLAEVYLCILLGKGAGTGWAFEAEIAAVKKIVDQCSPVLLDVGANMGNWSFLIQQLYPNSRIYMIEPQPVCQKKIREKKIPNAILIPKIVSSSTSKIRKLYLYGDSSGEASLYKRHESFLKNKIITSIEAPTVTIDSIISEYKLPHVDFMKIDVEGHELSVLNGAIHSLKTHMIKALSFEFGSCNIASRTTFRDFWDFLTPLGYKIYRILPSSQLLEIKSYYEDCEYYRGVTNYIAMLSQR